MKNTSQSTYINMSAYVALSCLIAFIVVITICLVKQFIWDALLSERFEVLRPVLSESVRKLSTSFYRRQSFTTSNISSNKSVSQSSVKTNEPPLLTNNSFITIPQNLPSTDSHQIHTTIHKVLPRRSYGSSSFSAFAYTNFGSEALTDEKVPPHPILHFSCEYNPSTFSIRLNVQNLRNMNSLLLSFNHIINKSAYVFLRFALSTTVTGEPYETSLQRYQDFIRFGETFNILSNIRSGDALNYEIKFFLMLITDKNMYELGETSYPMKDDQLTHTLYIERILPIRLGKRLKTATSEDNS